MKSIFAGLIALAFTTPAWAITFQADKDHCKAGEYTYTNPLSGGTSSGPLSATAWAETGLCLKIPIGKLANAAPDENVMTWNGVTRIDGFQGLPLKGVNQLFDIQITYEAYHSQFICEEAQWPLEWQGTVTQGTTGVPNQVLVHAERIPGGDSNGAYVKGTSVLIELTRYSATETSLHMRYEVNAPQQDASSALAAITQYVDRMKTVANGGKAPGATPDPNCPYNN